ncbi:hypothetical protein C8R43DRAFT_895466 [Mycena crocata]|nr:hypothetical protein C8R43DRAFT_895466 [Mycena crocata]
MRLKSYLELDPEKRATWAYIADSTLARHTLEKPVVEKGTHINTFVQSWSPKRSKLPPRLKEMVNVAKKYGVVFDTYQPPQKIRRELPLFHHFAEDRSKSRINNTKQCKCLRLRHEAATMEDGERISARLGDRRHRPDKRCTCLDCVDDRAFRKCGNPHACAKMALLKLDSVQKKWDPRTPDAPRNAQTDPGIEDETIFVSSEPIESLTEGFRIFTKPGRRAIIGPAPLLKTGRDGGVIPRTISIGSAVHKSGSAEAQAGAGVWHGSNDPENRSIAIPQELDQTMTNAEVVAALIAVQSYSANTEIRVESTKNHVLRAVTKNLSNWEDKGWTGTPYKEQTMALAAAIRSRTAKTTIAVVKDKDGVKEAITMARDASKGLNATLWTSRCIPTEWCMGQNSRL